MFADIIAFPKLWGMLDAVDPEPYQRVWEHPEMTKRVRDKKPTFPMFKPGVLADKYNVLVPFNFLMIFYYFQVLV